MLVMLVPRGQAAAVVTGRQEAQRAAFLSMMAILYKSVRRKCLINTCLTKHNKIGASSTVKNESWSVVSDYL